jgi:catechol 2,3-dioxygenase-like lactoylglutathione lyase family enzyme
MANLNATGIVVSDLERSIRFYRLPGLDVPETPAEGHVDTVLPNGVRCPSICTRRCLKRC